MRDPMPPLPDDVYRRARARARRRPRWVLRRREAEIVRRRPRPSDAEIAELRAIKAELRVRAVRKAPLRWWRLAS